MGRSGKRNALVVSNVFGKLPGGGGNAAAVIARPEVRNHYAAGVASARVVDDRFGAVTDFYAVLPVIGSDEEENTFVGFFAPDADLFVEIGGVGFNVIAVERFNRDDGHLSAGFLLKLSAQSFELGLGLRLEDTGEIGHVAGGPNSLKVFGACDGDRAQYRASDTEQGDEKSSNHGLGHTNESISPSEIPATKQM